MRALPQRVRMSADAPDSNARESFPPEEEKLLADFHAERARIMGEARSRVRAIWVEVERKRRKIREALR